MHACLYSTHCAIRCEKSRGRYPSTFTHIILECLILILNTENGASSLSILCAFACIPTDVSSIHFTNILYMLALLMLSEKTEVTIISKRVSHQLIVNCGRAFCLYQCDGRMKLYDSVSSIYEESPRLDMTT